jgi:hypothetical protein
MIFGLQWVPEVQPQNFRLWLGIVGVGAAVAFVIWLARGKRWSLADKQAHCQHEFEEFDNAGDQTFYKCRKCGVMRRGEA